MKVSFISFVVVVMGPAGEEDNYNFVVENFPYWERTIAERDQLIAQCAAAWCNKHRTAPKAIIVQELASPR